MSRLLSHLIGVVRSHIASRILAGFGLIALLACLVATVSLVNVTVVNGLLDELARSTEADLSDRLLAQLQLARSRSNAATIAALVLVGLGGFIATGIALLVTRSITRPLLALARAATAMKGGNLAVEVPVKGPDEIGTLAQTMAQMAASLRASQHSLESSLAETEQRNRELLALNTVASTAAAALDRQPLLEGTLDILLELTGVEFGAFQLPDEHGVIHLAAYRGFSELFLRAVPAEPIRAVLEEVIRTGQPALMDELTVEPREIVEPLRAEGIQSALAVPLTSPRSTVGLLTLCSRSGRRFEASDIALLTSIGSQVGIAIENVALLEQQRWRITNLSIINEVGRAISAELDLDTLYGVIYDQCRRTLDMPTFTIAVWDDVAAALTPALVYLDGQRIDPTDHWRERPPVLLKIVAEQRRPLLTNDYHATLSQYGVEPPEHIPNIRRSWLGVPMTVGERLIGIIVAATPNTTYSGEDSSLIAAIATQAAVAIENARLYRQTRELGVIEERNRLAREIHDTIAQGLTGLVLQLEATATLLESRPERARQRLSKATELARSTLTEARRSVWNLRPAPLEERSLSEAITAEVERLGDEGLMTECRSEGEPVPLLPETENALYRIVQEALQNIRKHADASRVAVTLSWAADSLTLTVHDDGRGFDPGQVGQRQHDGGGFGLLSMRERARLIGGQLSIESAPGQGTELTVQVPLAAQLGIPRPTQPASPAASRAALP